MAITISTNSKNNYYKQYIERWEELRDQALAARAAATQAAVERMESRRPALAGQRQDAMQDSYVRQQQSLKNLPQQMAAAGFGGSGLSESALVGLDARYGNELNQARRSYDLASGALDHDIAEERAKGDIELANISRDYEEQILKLQQQLEALKYKK